MLGRLRRTLRQAVGGLVLALAVTAGLLCPAGTASASTGDGSVSHVWLNLGHAPSPNLRISYSTFLASLRAAVGNSLQGVEVAQAASQNEGVVRVSLSAVDDHGTERAVDLWINPDNLYLVGYSPQATPGVSYIFNDIHASAAIPTARQNLPFGGNYNSLVGAAHRDRSNTPISFSSIRQAVLDLANQRSAGSNQQTTARALLLLIQFTSEAARFNDLEGVFRNVLADWGNSGSGIPSWLQQMENNWGTLSNFFWNDLGFGNNPHPAPLTIGGIRINNASDVRRYVRTVLTPVVGTSFNPGHQEL
ncbi:MULTISPECIES: ribosome-inactivating family protein [Kitasatospora]|uniref:Uncharacterized protein n=1 Tax=Kitasatospora cathayae TaxID=3004092 RepID=A0ABY7Q1M3_9ACTN|nr:ribosome-inactivating family protein [Kitasatospora sp. HUAS 3-15]WBP86347.1 hypothetical protein O1G21_11160 [Kitasatospora sp. HUAS 3-15]